MFLSKKPAFHVTALILLCALQFFFLLGHYALWDIDEGMHAVIAKNMVLSGDWITPVFNGKPFFDKPALFNWLGAIAFMLLGFTEFAARLPAALAGLGCVILTYLIGRRAYGATTGFIAGIILATSLEFAIMSRVVQYDIPFTFFVALALYFFCSALLDEEKTGRQFLWFYVATGLAVLVKGPLGLLLPAMVIGSYVLVQRRWSLLARLRLPLGSAIFVLLVLPWYFLVDRANPGCFKYFMLGQNLASFVGDVANYAPRHVEPWHYYFPYLIAGLFPWGFLLPQALYWAFRGSRGRERKYSIFLLLWVAVAFVFFSMATSKLSTYILPLYPAAALLVARYFQTFLDASAEATRGIVVGLSCALLLSFGLGAYVLVADPWPALALKDGLQANEMNLFIVVIILLLGTALLAAWRSRRTIALVGMAAVTPFAVLFLTAFVIPDALPFRSAKDVGLAYDRLLPAGEKMVFHGQMLDSAIFYTGREAIELPTRDALQEYLANNDDALVILRSRTRDPSVGLQGDFAVIALLGNKAIVANPPQAEQR